MGVLIVRALIFWDLYHRAPDFWKLPFVYLRPPVALEPPGAQEENAGPCQGTNYRCI